MTLEWPKFELAVFSGWDDVPPEARDGLMRVGVPKNSLGMLYRASEEPVSVQVPGYGELIRFGNAGLSGGVYMDPSSGHIVELIDHPRAVPRLVNTTLEQFVATIKTVIDLFPFYHGTADWRRG